MVAPGRYFATSLFCLLWQRSHGFTSTTSSKTLQPVRSWSRQLLPQSHHTKAGPRRDRSSVMVLTSSSWYDDASANTEDGTVGVWCQPTESSKMTRKLVDVALQVRDWMHVPFTALQLAFLSINVFSVLWFLARSIPWVKFPTFCLHFCEGAKGVPLALFDAPGQPWACLAFALMPPFLLSTRLGSEPKSKLTAHVVRGMSMLGEVVGAAFVFQPVMLRALQLSTVFSSAMILWAIALLRGQRSADENDRGRPKTLRELASAANSASLPVWLTIEDPPLYFIVLGGPFVEEFVFRFAVDRLWQGMLLWMATFKSCFSQSLPTGVQTTYASGFVLANSILFGLFHVSNYFPLFPQRRAAIASMLSDDEEVGLHNIDAESASIAVRHCILSTLIALFVFNPAYQKGGLAASFGAHATWNAAAMLLFKRK